MAVLRTPGARGRTPSRQLAPAVAVLRTPGREGGHLEQHAPAVAGLRTSGRGKSYLAVGTPRPQPFCARRGGREDNRQATRPGCGRSAHAGAGKELPSGRDALAAAGLCLPGREGGH